MTESKNLSRLLRAYPAKVKAQVDLVPPTTEASDAKAVLSRFYDATERPVGKAIMIAVILDQDESGERPLDPPTRAHLIKLFEDIFIELAS